VSEFAANLRAESATWSSAYLQFVTGIKSEGFDSYAFVEDDPDKDFYQHVLSTDCTISYISCGGKSGVITLFRKLEMEGLADGHLFFVDQDTEDQPGEHSGSICRTDGYSWESHFCTREAVELFLGKRMERSLPPRTISSLGARWLATIDAFADVLAWHTALCRGALLRNCSLELGRVPIAKDSQFRDGIIHPCPKNSAWVDDRVAAAEDEEILIEDTKRRFERYRAVDLAYKSRGKTVFQILSAFLVEVIRDIGVGIRGEFNSAIHWLRSIPSGLGAFDYIRAYAQSRCSKCFHAAIP
jgi:hypothetical protein